MKRVVTSGDLTQAAMRPVDLQNAYLEHVAADIERFELLLGGTERYCPACGASGTPEFERLGFAYRRCTACGSLFISPLPDAERLARYHAEGGAERYRRERLLPLTAGVRAHHTVSPRAHWVLASTASRQGQGCSLSLFGDQSPQLAELLRVSANILPWPASSSPEGRVQGVIAFDVLERAWDFPGTLGECRRGLRDGGLLFVTTVSGDGFELRMLGPMTAALVPPVHLQLLSREGWRIALARERFRIVEYSTPGELDVQAVAEACRLHPDITLPPVIDELVRHDDEQVRRAFQEVLQQACLSAHVQLVAEALPVE